MGRQASKACLEACRQAATAALLLLSLLLVPAAPAALPASMPPSRSLLWGETFADFAANDDNPAPLVFTPISMPGEAPFVAVASGGFRFTCLLDALGKAYCVGEWWVRGWLGGQAGSWVGGRMCGWLLAELAELAELVELAAACRWLQCTCTLPGWHRGSPLLASTSTGQAPPPFKQSGKER